MGVIRRKCDHFRFVQSFNVLAVQKLLTTSNDWSVYVFSLGTRSIFGSKPGALLTARAIGRVGFTVSKPRRIRTQSLIKVFFRTQSNSRREKFLKRWSKLDLILGGVQRFIFLAIRFNFDYYCVSI